MKSFLVAHPVRLLAWQIAVTMAALWALVAASRATFSLQFSNIGGGKLATNFANADGSPTDGMNWGIVISTGDNLFQGDGSAFYYDPFILSMAGSPLMVNGLATDDFFVLSEAVTADSSMLLEDNDATPGAPGTIVEITDIAIGANGVTAGDTFALVWFSKNNAGPGDPYGFYYNPTFVVPSDGATVVYDSPFEAVDPIRQANLLVAPEPNTVLLSLLGLGFCASRRRCR